MKRNCTLTCKTAKPRRSNKKRSKLSIGLYIRPDNLVTLKSGRKVIFEVEQVAKPDYLPRITRSLRQKLAYFSHDPGERISTEIRMAFNLKPGALYRKIRQRWTGVYQLLARTGFVSN